MEMKRLLELGFEIDNSFLDLKKLDDRASHESDIFEKYMGPVCIILLKGELIHIARASRRYINELGLNISEQDIINSMEWDFSNDENRKLFLAALENARAKQSETTCETWRNYNSICCGDDCLCIKSSIICLGTNDDSSLYFVKIQNITEDRRMLDSLMSSDKLFKYAADQINEYAWEFNIWTKEMRPCYRCMRDLDLPAVIENYPESAFEMGIFPPEVADIYRNWLKQLETGVASLDGIYPLTMNRIPFHIRYTTEFDENGKPVKAYASAAMVIENDSEELEYLEIVDALTQNYLNVYCIDKELKRGKKIKGEDGMPDQLQKLRKNVEVDYYETVKEYIESFVYEEDRERLTEELMPEVVLKKLTSDSPLTGIYRKVVDGSILYFQYKFLHLAENKPIILGFQNIDLDVRKQKEDERQLEDALQKAKKANLAKTTFLSHMSHDIRTPLNGIIGLLDIDDRHPDDLKLLTENRKKTRIAADHLLSLINDVLELSKMEDDNVVLVHEAFNIRTLVEDVITIGDMRAGESAINLINQTTPNDMPVQNVYGSSLHLRQLLLNILGNSVKYNTVGGSITFRTELVGRTPDKVTYRFTISDTGIGMSKDFLEHIFEPFSQERQDTKSVYYGTGLGMSIVKSLVEKMHGTISIDSEINVGSTFVVTIPFDIADTVNNSQAQTDTQSMDIRDVRVLVVEDNDLNLQIAKFLLEDAGAIISTASNGKEAVECFESNAPDTYDVILMDIMMPVMDGFLATKNIRSLDRADAKTIPIIAMTANAFEEDKKAALDAGMNAHIAKPLNIKEVLGTISRFAKSI